MPISPEATRPLGTAGGTPLQPALPLDLQPTVMILPVDVVVVRGHQSLRPLLNWQPFVKKSRELYHWTSPLALS